MSASDAERLRAARAAAAGAAALFFEAQGQGTNGAAGSGSSDSEEEFVPQSRTVKLSAPMPSSSGSERRGLPAPPVEEPAGDLSFEDMMDKALEIEASDDLDNLEPEDGEVAEGGEDGEEGGEIEPPAPVEDW
jgi:hypothetical protein